MIRRIVKMTFKRDSIDDFLLLFDAVKENIRNFDGVDHMELYQDANDEDVFFTISNWNSQEHLTKYRKSELFKSTWAQMKTHFAKKAEAWSISIIETQ